MSMRNLKSYYKRGTMNVFGIPHEDLLMITDERFDNHGKSAII